MAYICVEVDIFMSIIQLIGLTAGALTTTAFLPQVIKTWRSRSAKDLSLGMFSLFCLGVALYFTVARIPLGFAGDGRDTAAAVLFLASDEARFVTGTELIVDGGMSVRCG